MEEPKAKRQKLSDNVFTDSKVNEQDEEKFKIFDEIMRNVKVTPDINYLEDPEYIELLDVSKKRKLMIDKEITQWSFYLQMHIMYFKYINTKLFELNEMQMNLLPNDIYFTIILKEYSYKEKLKIIEIRIIKIKNILKFLEIVKLMFNVQLSHNSLKYPLLKPMVGNFDQSLV